MFEQLVDRLKKKTERENEIRFGSFEEVREQTESAELTAPEPAAPVQEAAAVHTKKSDNIELKVVRPESFDDVTVVADHLLRGCTVVLNLEVMDRSCILRMLDFLNGVTYATDGDIKKVAPGTYIITARGVDVSDAE